MPTARRCSTCARICARASIALPRTPPSPRPPPARRCARSRRRRSTTAAGAIAIVDRATEDAWLHDRFHPARLREAAELLVGLAGTPGAVIALAREAGLGADEPVDGIAPGHAAGDVVVRVDGIRDVVLRRQEGSGLTVISDALVRHRGEGR